MNTAVVETEEEDNTSNVAAGVRAAALGRNEGVWGGRRRKARQDGLRGGLAPEHPGDARPSGARGQAEYRRRVYEREAGGAEGKTRARELWSRGLTGSQTPSRCRHGYISLEFFIFY